MIAENFGAERNIFMEERSLKEVQELWPPDGEAYYEVRVGKTMPATFTGVLAGGIPFINGVARVTRHFHVRQALIRGCRNITGPEQREKLKQRDLKKIMVVRAAAFGDGTIMSPVFAALRKAYPDAEIAVFGRQDSKVVYQYIPGLDYIVGVRDVELATLVYHYDEVFDMTQSIENNAEADFMNSLDVARDIMMLEPIDEIIERQERLARKEVQPVYIMTPEDLQGAVNIFNELGVDPNSKNIVILQLEATAQVRTLTYTQALVIAYKLADLGYTVICVGHNINLPHARLLHSDSCETEACIEGVVLPPGASGINRPCPTCDPEGEPREFLTIPRHERVFFTQQLFGRYDPRQHFAMAHFAQVIVTVDSFWGHLAAAIEKPHVMIFSNYHPHTRMKYYKDATLIAPDYHHKVQCGPCNSLFNECPLYPGESPLCITSLDVQRIVDATVARLRGERPLYQEWRDMPSAHLNSATRECPVCRAFDNCSPLTAKGSHIYLECHNCQSFYTQEFPNFEFWTTLNRKVKGNKFYRPSRNVPVTEWLTLIKQVIQQNEKEKPLPDAHFADLVGISDRFVERTPYREQVPGFCAEYDEDGMETIDEDLVIWVDGLMECIDVKSMLLIQLNRMRGRFLALILPLTERYVNTPNWFPLHSPVAGLHTVIPSLDGMKELIKPMGHVRMIGGCTTERSGLIVLEKQYESEEVNGESGAPPDSQQPPLDQEQLE